MNAKPATEILNLAENIMAAKEAAEENDIDDRTIIWISASEGESEDDEPHMNFCRVRVECLTEGFTPSRIKTLQLATMKALANYDKRDIPLSKDIAGELLIEFFNLVHGRST